MPQVGRTPWSAADALVGLLITDKDTEHRPSGSAPPLPIRKQVRHVAYHTLLFLTEFLPKFSTGHPRLPISRAKWG
jgi:hypothetical protein